MLTGRAGSAKFQLLGLGIEDKEQDRNKVTLQPSELVFHFAAAFRELRA
jgi:hypothetical protein